MIDITPGLGVCYHCKKNIDDWSKSLGNVYELSLLKFDGHLTNHFNGAIYFHKECWQSIAGDKYVFIKRAF